MLKLIEDAIERTSAAPQASAPEVRTQSDIDEELKKLLEQIQAKIYVVGVGGAGCNTINRMMQVGIQGAKIIAMNTDAQDLLKVRAHKRSSSVKSLPEGLVLETTQRSVRRQPKRVREKLERLSRALTWSLLPAVSAAEPVLEPPRSLRRSQRRWEL